MKPKAMISQPMGGLTKEEILNTRKEATEYLESQGYEVLDTYYENLGVDDESSINRGLWYLGRSLMDMARIQVVYFVEGWEQNRGCLVEYEAARRYGCKLIFDKTHSEKTPLTFGEALILLRSGHPMARKGWNGKGVFVVYQKGYPEGINCNRQTAEAWGIKEGSLFKCDPYLQISTTDGSHAMWQPSVRDCLAQDWYIVDTTKDILTLVREQAEEIAAQIVSSNEKIQSASVEIVLEEDE